MQAFKVIHSIPIYIGLVWILEGFSKIRGWGVWGVEEGSHTLLCVPNTSVMGQSGLPSLFRLPIKLSFQMHPSNPRSVEI